MSDCGTGLIEIANQPVKFTSDIDPDACNDNFYKQLVEIGDITQFQLKTTPCNYTADSIIAGGFDDPAQWSLGAGWSISSEQLIKSSGGLGPVSQPNIFFTGYKYTVIVNVQEISGTFTVLAGNGPAHILNATGQNVFVIDGLDGSGISILPLLPTHTCVISSISAYEIPTNLIVGIWDEQGVYQNSINPTDDPDYFIFHNETVTVSIDWETLGITAGCYYIGVADPCINTHGQNGLIDGTFRFGNAFWAEIENLPSTMLYVPATGTAVYNSSSVVVSGNPMTLEAKFITFNNGSIDLGPPIVFNNNSMSFDVEITIANYINMDSVIINIAGSTHTLTSNGSHSFTLAPSATPVPAPMFINFRSSMVNATVTISALKVTMTNASDLTADISSGLFNLKSSWFRTNLFYGCNDEDSFGMVFNGSGFIPRIRLHSKRVNASYPSDRETERNSNGRKFVRYYDRVKEKQFKIDRQPEYVHDFLSLMIGMDNTYLNDDQVFVTDDEYRVDYADEMDDFGSPVINLEPKQELVRNVMGSSNEKNGNLENRNTLDEDGNCIYDEDGSIVQDENDL